MEELAPGIGVGDYGQKILQFGASVADGIAHGILHEAVGDDNPHGGKIGGESHGPYGETMHLFAYLVPAEGPHRNECGLQKKGRSRFNGQERTENITDVGGIF